jgi:hypothetical protein
MGDNRNLTGPCTDENSQKRTLHGPLLALLTALFACRVAGQVLVAVVGVTWLPAMERWYSGLIPYPTLLIIQLLMLMFMIKITGEIWQGKGNFAVVRPHWSSFLKIFAAAYAGIMAIRYVLTMIVHPEMRWVGDIIPIIFHFVLAVFIFILGDYHRMTTDR